MKSLGSDEFDGNGAAATVWEFRRVLVPVSQVVFQVSPDGPGVVGLKQDVAGHLVLVGFDQAAAGGQAAEDDVVVPVVVVVGLEGA